jgi:hypothetical protein
MRATSATPPAKLRAGSGVLLLTLAVLMAPALSSRALEAQEAAKDTVKAVPAEKRWSSFLPFMKDEALKRGIELPRPFGAGAVFYHLDRDIKVTDLRLGRNGAPPVSVSEFATLASNSKVDNLNAKLDVWLLPFLNVYGIVGTVANESATTVSVTLPPLLPNGSPRTRTVTVPTSIRGTVAGVGITLAGGYGPYFMVYDANAAQADLNFDEKFKVVVSSIRGGWNGTVGSRPLRAWASVMDWNTFATATGTVTDPDGGTLRFEVDQGPAYRYTYGVGGQYSATRWFELAVDAGTDGHGGWYVALIPVIRF